MADFLIVEDEPDILTQLATMLRRAKHTVYTAGDGADAIKLLGLQGGEAVLPDIVILDIMMPNTNGYAVVSAMQKFPSTHDIPVVLLSGYTDLEEVFHKFKNVKAFLPKPIDVPKLLNTVADLLAAKRGLH